MRTAPPYRFSSAVYDGLVGEYAHQHWKENCERLLKQYPMDLSLVADVACGTGLNAAYLAGLGSEIYAVDISPSMLREAARRLAGFRGVTVLRQDMRHLELPRRAGTLFCATDSINHLLRKEDILLAAGSFYRNLRPGGHLVCDANTAWQLREGADDVPWEFELDGWHVTWKSDWDVKSQTAVLGMCMRRGDEGFGQELRETHRERAYPAAFLEGALREAGFRAVEVRDAAGLGKPGARTRRLLFVAVK